MKVEAKKELLSRIEEIRKIIKNKGVHGVAEQMFNTDNKNNKVPKYADFIEAFEFFSKKKRSDFKIQTVGQLIYFQVENKEYTMDTYEGKTEELKSIIENGSYEEIYTMTNENIWSEIYLDAGIEKEEFIPKLLFYWENYWEDQYRRIKKEVGSTKHLDTMRDRSWRQFKIFSDSYNDVGDIIKYSYRLDDMELYPLVVVTMLNIFDAEVCYDEYCECEFYTSNGWESVCVDIENESKHIFYVRINEK